MTGGPAGTGARCVTFSLSEMGAAISTDGGEAGASSFAASTGSEIGGGGGTLERAIGMCSDGGASPTRTTTAC